jgi:L-lactate dehydrogenase complex protein LldF
VIVDNGRSALLADPQHRSALACIRCGACLNTCPVYRRAGGHAYAQTVPGPIGAVLGPALGRGDAAALPQASSLCGSCSAVCPVRIDLHDQLLAWRRREATPRGAERAALRLAAALLARPRAYRAAGRALRRLWPLLGRRLPGHPLAGWLACRELPEPPGPSFAERYARELRGPRGPGAGPDAADAVGRGRDASARRDREPPP